MRHAWTRLPSQIRGQRLREGRESIAFPKSYTMSPLQRATRLGGIWN